ncbi:RNA-binding S4 domain-containing protein [Thiosulfativibrio zosterae]|uniref:Heat shock protein 15 n=1 Tax=Thiosulfativibrio zosterae TaxID=2675053 RepID=A0A6F8PJI6_9GAMM|nr:RNA-binding S4 domain-containing protein [Thiosulfativibrio zosterae]BBP42263.1 RNA-binding protein S4 [Thiosulfativibrio zosterae]
MEDLDDKVRVDKWLWAARFFKTRGLALEALKGGKIELNGQKPKPSKVIALGDELSITQEHRKVKVTVLAISDKRGSAEMAEHLYRLNEELLNQRKPTLDMALVGYREKGAGRPTKRDRRKIEAIDFGF